MRGTLCLFSRPFALFVVQNNAALPPLAPSETTKHAKGRESDYAGMEIRWGIRSSIRVIGHRHPHILTQPAKARNELRGAHSG